MCVHLTFSDQISPFSKSCYYHICQIRCILPCLYSKTASTIVTSVVHSKLNYWNSLYQRVDESQSWTRPRLRSCGSALASSWSKSTSTTSRCCLPPSRSSTSRETLELSSIAGSAHVASLCRSGARFTKYLTTILRLSYDNAKVTIDIRRTSNLRKHPTKGARLFLGTIHLQTCKIVLDSVYKLAYDIPKRNFGTF